MMSACSVSFPAFLFLFNDKKRVLWKLMKHHSPDLLNVFTVYKFCMFVNYEINVVIKGARVL